MEKLGSLHAPDHEFWPILIMAKKPLLKMHPMLKSIITNDVLNILASKFNTINLYVFIKDLQNLRLKY
ncbi:MAG: hypothetical protein Crog4KO_36880 [Crocinitomicaceae bacterium]